MSEVCSVNPALRSSQGAEVCPHCGRTAKEHWLERVKEARRAAETIAARDEVVRAAVAYASVSPSDVDAYVGADTRLRAAVAALAKLEGK